MRLFIRCAVAYENWDIAEMLADLLRDGEEPDRQEAAGAYQALAAAYYAAGDLRNARASVEAALAVRPEQRMAIMEDPRFPPDFV